MLFLVWKLQFLNERWHLTFWNLTLGFKYHSIIRKTIRYSTWSTMFIQFFFVSGILDLMFFVTRSQKNGKQKTEMWLKKAKFDIITAPSEEMTYIWNIFFPIDSGHIIFLNGFFVIFPKKNFFYYNRSAKKLIFRLIFKMNNFQKKNSATYLMLNSFCTAN